MAESAPMTTDMLVSEPVTVGGVKLVGETRRGVNHILTSVANLVTAQQIAMLESQSANTSGSMVPREVRKFRSMAEYIKSTFEHMMSFNDTPTGGYELVREYTTLHPSQVAASPSHPVTFVVSQYQRLNDYISTCRSMNQEPYVDEENADEIRELFAAVDADINRHFGTGEQVVGDGVAPGTFNTGVAIPDINYVGTVVPPLDRNTVTRMEASVTAPPASTVDGPDFDPPGPAPMPS